MTKTLPDVRRYPRSSALGHVRWETPTVRRTRPRLRGLLIGLAVSTAFWLLAVVLPLWLHYEKGWGR